MQTKADLPKIESYSIALSEKLCNDFYKEDVSVISGSEILKFTNIEQLNLFIVKNLFDRWKEEAYKLRSPYFDYENESVKDALSVFLNKLSKHIAIRKEFFKPLVRKAIADTLHYTIDPSQFIKIEFLGKPIVSLSEILEREKYLKINKFLIQSLIKKLQLQNKSGFPENEVLIYFEEVYKNYESSLESKEKHIDAFSDLLKINLEDLTIVNSSTDPSVAPKMEIPVAAVVTPKPTPSAPVKNTYVDIDPSSNSNSQTSTLNEIFAKKNQLSLNDLLMKEDDSTIVAKHRKSKIHDLRTAVPINLRFIFINELFKGSGDDYELAITQIERCENFDAAKNILDQVYGRKYSWEAEKTEVKEYFELVERRFY